MDSQSGPSSKYTFTLPHCALGQECFKQVWLNSGQRLCPQPPWTGWRRLGVSPPKGGLLAGILKSSQREPESPFPLVKRSPALGFAWVSLPPAARRNGPFITSALGETSRKLDVNMRACQQPVAATAYKLQVNSVVISGAAALETLASAGAGPCLHLGSRAQ